MPSRPPSTACSEKELGMRSPRPSAAVPPPPLRMSPEIMSGTVAQAPWDRVSRAGASEAFMRPTPTTPEFAHATPPEPVRSLDDSLPCNVVATPPTSLPVPRHPTASPTGTMPTPSPRGHSSVCAVPYPLAYLNYDRDYSLPSYYIQVIGKCAHCTGIYHGSQQIVNGFPTWYSSQCRRWLYTTPNGYWRVTSDAADFHTGAGYIVSADPHRGTLPAEVPLWQSKRSNRVDVSFASLREGSPRISLGGDPSYVAPWDYQPSPVAPLGYGSPRSAPLGYESPGIAPLDTSSPRVEPSVFAAGDMSPRPGSTRQRQRSMSPRTAKAAKYLAALHSAILPKSPIRNRSLDGTRCDAYLLN